MRQQPPRRPSAWVVISCALLLLAASAIGDTQTWWANGQGEDNHGSLQTGEEPEGTYKSLRDILDGENVTYRHRAEMSNSGPPGIASQREESAKAAGLLSFASQPTFNGTTLSQMTSSTEIPSSPGVTDVTSSSQDTSREVATSAPVVSTTIRNYYCLSPNIPSDVMILPTEDQNWEVGSTHTITCLTNPTSGFTSSDISLSLGFHGDPIPHQVVDNCTITATVTITEPGNYKLFCATELSPPKICTRSLSVGYPPLDVTNLECKSWNWNVLECSWRIPDNPTQEPADDYQVHLVSTIGRSECRCDGGVGRCGTRSEGCMKTCCSWAKPYYLPAEQFLTVNFTAANQLGSSSFPHKINNWNSVVPDEAQNIVVTTTAGSLEVSVKWDMPVYIRVLAPWYGVYHAVEYQLDPSIYGAAPWELGSVDVCKVKKCGTRFYLEHPGATYQIRVRLRVNRTNFTLEDDGWWSKATAAQCDVPAQRPWNPPRSSAGAFQVWSGNGRRDISVSWRPLPPQQHNGPNFTYVADASANGKPLLHSEITDTYVLYRNVSEHSYVRVNVKSSNALGVSNTSASVAILPTALMPAGPVLQVVVYHADVRRYELTWYEPSQLNNNYTIYVCTDNQDSKDQCKGDLHWMDAGNKTSVNVTLEDFGLGRLDSKDLRFAVSSETHGGKFSSGMSWDDCYHPQAYRKTTMPPTLSKFIPVTSTSANISWTLDCENRAGVVEGIVTEWCQGNRNFSSCNVTETTNRTDVVSGLVSLSDLEPDTEYIVHLKLRYRQRLSGWSRNMTFTTSKTIRPAMAAWLIATIASGCIMVAVSIVGCFSYGKTKVKEFLIIYKKPINIPAGITRDIIPKPPDQKPPLTEKSTTPVAVDASAAKQSGESKHPGEIETLIKKSGNPENELTGPSPRQLGMAPVPQSPGGYIQAFSPDTVLNYVSIEGDLTPPRRVVEEGPDPPNNGYILQDYAGVGHPAEGTLTDERQAPMLELSEFSPPSSGYVSVLHHPGNINKHGYVESAFFPESVPGANVEPPLAKGMGLMKAVTDNNSSSEHPNSSIPGKGRGYVQLDFTDAYVVPPELLQQSSQDSGLGDEQQAYSTSDESLTPADHPLVEESQGRRSSENDIKSLSKDNIIRNGRGYVENPFLQDDAGGYRDLKPESSGPKMLPSGVKAYVDIQDCFQYGFPIREDSSAADVETTREEAVRLDTGVIGKHSMEFTQAGYVKTEISHENGVTLMGDKDTLGAQPSALAVEMRSALSYVMMPESAAEVCGKMAPQDGGAYVSGDFLCKSVDLGEASNLLSGYGDRLKSREKSSFCPGKGKADPATYSHGVSRGDPPVGYCRIGDGEW